jgi:hypothetical protein
LRTIEDSCAAGEPIHQPGAHQRFERVPARDGERCGDIARSRNVLKSPTKMQARLGNRARQSASAIPPAATGDALACNDASIKPSLPAMK